MHLEVLVEQAFPRRGMHRGRLGDHTIHVEEDAVDWYDRTDGAIIGLCHKSPPELG